MTTEKIKEHFSELIRIWRTAESQRTIFGVQMIQTQKALDQLFQRLQKLLAEYPAFSLIKKEKEMAVVLEVEKTEENPSGVVHVPAAFPTMPKIFEQLKISSIALKDGLTREEIKSLFVGFSTKTDEIEAQGGLKGFLQSQAVEHITVDQMQFKLLKDGEEAGAGEGKGGPKGGAGGGEGTGGAGGRKGADVWKEFLSGELDEQELTKKYKELLEAAKKDPKLLEKIIKKLISRRKEARKLFAEAEQKLGRVGVSAEVINKIKTKLFKPKKVLVDEEELARLKEIEKAFHGGGGQGQGEGGGGGAFQGDLFKTQQKLSDETARSESFMHQMGRGGMILGKDKKILSADPDALKMLGVSETEIIGKTVEEILKPHQVLTAVSDWQNESDDHTPHEIHVETRDDETFSVIKGSAIVIQNESGRAVGVLSQLHNVTQQEDMYRRKNDILDVLGHDLRAPLGAIKQNFEVLVQTSLSDAGANEMQKKFIENCNSSILRMSRLIEKILDMRQLEAGKIMLKYDQADAGKLIEQAATSLNDLAAKKNIEIKVAAVPLPEIECDPERLYQVVMNLVSNAVKFTPEKGTINVNAKTVDKEGADHIEVSVKDSGMGIDKTDLDRIFNKYEQVTVNAPAGVRGLGLGLSICKTIVDMHGGIIWADSEVEKGSTFTFQVPVKRNAEQ